MKKTNRKKTLSRLMAIQIFYQNDFLKNEKDLEEIKHDVIENYLLDSEENISSYRKKIDEEFLNNLVAGLDLGSFDINSEIAQFLKEGYKLEKLDGVLRQILRLGTFELKYTETAPKVVVSEYTDIAASFFDEGKVKFVNATLDAISKKFHSETTTHTKKPHEENNEDEKKH